jgi:hypothetical protein
VFSGGDECFLAADMVARPIMRRWQRRLAWRPAVGRRASAKLSAHVVASLRFDRVTKMVARSQVQAKATGRPQQTIRHASTGTTLKKLGVEGEKGQVREWMTAAIDIEIAYYDNDLKSRVRAK